MIFGFYPPDHGTTTAKRNDGGYLVNGAKTFISGVEDADAILVVARTAVDEATGKGKLSLFIVDVEAAGLTRQHIPTALSTAEKQSMLFFDDVEVEADGLMGAEHHGLRVVFDGLNPERIAASVMCTAIARYAMDKASRYANERAVWGSRSGPTRDLAPPRRGEDRAGVRAPHGAEGGGAVRRGRARGSGGDIANFAAAEAGIRYLGQAIQSHRGNGIALEYDLARYWWGVRLLRTAPVSREMILNYVADLSLGLPRSY